MDELEQAALNRELWREVSGKEGDCSKVEMLLKQGADAKARDAMGLDALMRACSRGSDDLRAGALVRALLPSSDLGAVDPRGWGACAYAARTGTDAALAELVAVNAPMPKDLEGLEPSAYARGDAAGSLFEAAALRREVAGGSEKELSRARL